MGLKTVPSLTVVGRSVRALVVAAIVGSASVARADPDLAAAELATARALFEEGLAREDAKDWKGALERFKRVAEIKVTPNVLFNMGLCYERLGKTASADASYAKVEKGNVADLAKLAGARRKELSTKIPELVLEGGASDVTVMLDGVPAPTPGIAVAIDPGAHEVVSRRGKDTAKHAFEAPAATGKITIAIPLPAAPPSVAPEGPPPPRPFPVLAYVTGGLTVAGVGVGIFSVISRGDAISELDAACGPQRSQCPSSLRGTADRAETMSLVANIAFGAAIAAALATAGIVYFGWVTPAKR